MRCIIYCLHCHLTFVQVEFVDTLYSNIGVGLSALLVSDGQGQCESQRIVERATGQAPRIFVYAETYKKLACKGRLAHF